MIDSESDIFLTGLREMYWVEQELVLELHTLATHSTSTLLAQSLIRHAAQKERHVRAIEHIFALLEEKAIGMKCRRMHGLIDECKTAVKAMPTGLLRDVVIIASAKKMERHKCMTYEKLCRLSEAIRKTEVTDILHQNWKDEESAHDLLDSISSAYLINKAQCSKTVSYRVPFPRLHPNNI
jgi:ferritin-like metal-binding protein YciE